MLNSIVAGLIDFLSFSLSCRTEGQLDPNEHGFEEQCLGIITDGMAVFFQTPFCRSTAPGGGRGNYNREKPWGDTRYKDHFYLHLWMSCVCRGVCLTLSPHTPLVPLCMSLHSSPFFCSLWWLLLLSLTPFPLYLEPQPQRQLLLLLRVKRKIFGQKYWSGPGPFICITFKVSQGSHLTRWNEKKQQERQKNTTTSLFVVENSLFYLQYSF